MTSLRVAACIWALGITCSQAAEMPSASQVRSLELDNGMQILVWPDHDIPNVALYNWVRVGSRNEAPGITGLAHFFEHMMFNGTSTRPAGEFDRLMESQGGANNAFTSEDVTVYQDWVPRTALSLVFDLEADRLRNLAFDPKVVESERGVVYSERRLSVDDDPGGRLREQTQAAAFIAHPYHFPTIGWPSDIEGWRLEDLKQFFSTYYAAGNCTLVVVGDVEPEQVFALARRYLAPLPKKDPPTPVRTIEPPQLGERRVRIEAETQTPLLQFAYHGLAAKDPQGPALQLLLRILSDGDSSRLQRRLVQQDKLAVSVDAYMQSGFDPGLVWFFVTVPGSIDVAQVEQVFDAELERLLKEGVSAAELTKAKQLQMAGFWRALATIDGKAEALGRYAVLHGDFRKLFSTPQAYEAVSAEAVLEVARKLLRKQNRTVGTLEPVRSGA
jgi:zinc protease